MNSNEYDTFLKLKKIDYEELRSIINSLPKDEFQPLVDSKIRKEQFLNYYGWKSEEFDLTSRKVLST